MFGGSGVDKLSSGTGDDVNYGGTGGYTLYGGLGDDVFMVANQEDFDNRLYDGGEGTDTLCVGAGVTVPGIGTGFVSIEVTLFG